MREKAQKEAEYEKQILLEIEKKKVFLQIFLFFIRKSKNVKRKN